MASRDAVAEVIAELEIVIFNETRESCGGDLLFEHLIEFFIPEAAKYIFRDSSASRQRSRLRRVKRKIAEVIQVANEDWEDVADGLARTQGCISDIIEYLRNFLDDN